MWIYRNSFGYFKLGYGSAMSVVCWHSSSTEHLAAQDLADDLMRGGGSDYHHQQQNTAIARLRTCGERGSCLAFLVPFLWTLSNLSNREIRC